MYITDLTGLKVGRLTIIDRAENGKYGRPRWNCLCICGNTVVSGGANLKKGLYPEKYAASTHPTISCGCRQKEIARDIFIARNTTHGQSKTPKYLMYISAKRRAIKQGIPFELEFNSFPEIPLKCPVLGLLLKSGIGKPLPNSPSLDKIIPSLGYVEGNIQIISHRANTIKSDASVEEILAVANYVKLHSKLKGTAL